MQSHNPQPPSVSRAAHYVLPKGDPHEGDHRSAEIVKVVDAKNSIVELTVSLTSEDGPELHRRVENVSFSENPLPGTWHWPERV